MSEVWLKGAEGCCGRAACSSQHGGGMGADGGEVTSVGNGRSDRVGAAAAEARGSASPAWPLIRCERVGADAARRWDGHSLRQRSSPSPTFSLTGLRLGPLPRWPEPRQAHTQYFSLATLPSRIPSFTSHVALGRLLHCTSPPPPPPVPLARAL